MTDEIRDLEQRAFKGDSDALVSLGWRLENGQGVPVNLERAVECYRRAADLGNAVGANNLGSCYKRGTGVTQDYGLARFWYERAMEAGSLYAFANLGLLYQDGLGINQHVTLAHRLYIAHRLYRKAARSRDRSSDLAKALLAELYWRGQGVRRNVAKVEYWALQAASLNHHNSGLAHQILGFVYREDGNNSSWHKLACFANVIIRRYLSWRFLLSSGVDKNNARSLAHFSRAASQGDRIAQFQIGYIYESGLGVPKNETEAYRWYRLAADNDSEAALAKLKDQTGEVGHSSASALSEFSSLIGLDSAKQAVQALYNLMQANIKRKKAGLSSIEVSLHLVFTGNPGTGKTTVARIVGKLYREVGLLKKGQVVEVDRSGLVAEYIGQTAVKTNQVIDSALDGVLFIDEAYMLAAQNEKDFGPEAIATLLKRMEDDRNRLAIIVAGYPVEMEKFITQNPGLYSRFNRYIQFDDYSNEELLQIFLSIVHKAGLAISPGVETILLDEISKHRLLEGSRFGNARTVRNLFEKAVQQQANRLAVEKESTVEALSTLKPEDFG